MGKNEDMVELTHLEKIGKDCWKFSSRGNTSFDHVFESLCKAHTFEAKTVYLPGDDYYHFVNDQGIWLLSHCFSNWTEMYAQATKKSPWEEQWQKKQQETPPEHVNCRANYTEQGEPPHCVECDMALYDNYTYCQVCSHFTCSFCIEKHQKAHIEQKKCTVCNGDPAGPLVHCPSCQEEMCKACLEIHRKKHRAGWQTYSCAFCGNMAEGACPICGKHCCVLHISVHFAQHSPSGYGSPYSARREYGFTPDDMQNFEIYHRLYQNGIIDESEFKAKVSGQKQKQEPKGFWSAGQQTYSSSHHASGPSLEDLDSIIDSIKAQAKAQEEARRQAEEAARRERERQYSQQRTRTSAPSQELTEAFTLLNLSQRATVQEVKRAFRRKAKEAHPDTGGSEEQFKNLNAAYQLALAHAERNSR